MSTMIERVARAMWDAEPDDWEWTPAVRNMTWEQAVETHAIGVHVFRTLARAAIKAMRDVDSGTPRILRRGKEALYSCSSDPELEDARGCWEEMIDAALEEKP